LSDRGVLTAIIQLFLLNSIARRQRTASSWDAAGGRLFTVRASISISYALVVGSHRDGNTSVHRACIRSTTAECDFSRSGIIGDGSSPFPHGPEAHAQHSGR